MRQATDEVRVRPLDLCHLLLGHLTELLFVPSRFVHSHTQGASRILDANGVGGDTKDHLAQMTARGVAHLRADLIQEHLFVNHCGLGESFDGAKGLEHVHEVVDTAGEVAFPPLFGITDVLANPRLDLGIGRLGQIHRHLEHQLVELLRQDLGNQIGVAQVTAVQRL